jgi:hypothetical protein
MAMPSGRVKTGPDPWLTREAPAVRFPGAKAETLADAPARCSCGGTWLVEDGGLACRLCGRRLYVVTELRRMVERYGFTR